MSIPECAVFGAESAIRPDSLPRAGAHGLLHRLLVRCGTDVETLDDEALGDEWSEGKLTNGIRSNHIRDRMEMRMRTTMTFF